MPPYDPNPDTVPSKYYALTANGWIYGWSLQTGLPLWQPHQKPGLIRPGTISPDGTRIIAGHNDGHIRIYDTATGMLVQTLDHAGKGKTLRFAPDRSGRFISGSTDRLAHLWDLKTGRKFCTLIGHSHTVLASAWSPDSRYAATASHDPRHGSGTPGRAFRSARLRPIWANSRTWSSARTAPCSPRPAGMALRGYGMRKPGNRSAPPSSRARPAKPCASLRMQLPC